MFATVYLHFTPVIFERMLGRYFEESNEFDLPSDVERYANLDDMDLWLTLRKSKEPLGAPHHRAETLRAPRRGARELARSSRVQR